MPQKESSIKLSCLVTNYNQMEWIEEAVESILNQNMDFEYEILIGDDGSNDGSLELLENKYGKQKQIRIFVQDRDSSMKEFPNWRHSRLIFRLLDEARGEYISVLDGDDYFCDANHFQHKINLLDMEENKDCVACYGDMYGLTDDKLELYTKTFYAEGKYQWQKNMAYRSLATAVVHKKALEDVPRDIFYEQFVDWEVTVWLTHKGPFYYDPTPCFVYRILPNSIFHGPSADIWALRQVLVCDANFQAYGGKRIDAFKPRRSNVIRLYEKRSFFEDVDYEMWNAFAVKYHAKVAHMLLNRDKLKTGEKIWLFVFVLRLKAPWKILMNRILGYCIGIRQICSPKTSMEQKKALMKNWWARITKN